MKKMIGNNKNKKMRKTYEKNLFYNPKFLIIQLFMKINYCIQNLSAIKLIKKRSYNVMENYSRFIDMSLHLKK